jgi:hypothetical protein
VLVFHRAQFYHKICKSIQCRKVRFTVFHVWKKVTDGREFSKLEQSIKFLYCSTSVHCLNFSALYKLKWVLYGTYSALQYVNADSRSLILLYSSVLNAAEEYSILRTLHINNYLYYWLSCQDITFWHGFLFGFLRSNFGISNFIHFLAEFDKYYLRKIAVLQVQIIFL